jgi:hyperosmotically inducible protein
MYIQRVRRASAMALALLLLAAPAQAQSEPYNRNVVVNTEIRHELMTLPYTGVFDWFEWTYDKGTVTLSGSVRRAINKKAAADAVKRVTGVDEVVNNIEVLPTSPQDDRLRMELYRRIYRQASLEKYAVQSIPPIRIIVNNGRVTLKGTVLNEGDKAIAYAEARSVPGIFEVINELQVENPS